MACSINFEQLEDYVVTHCSAASSSIHGLKHWKRVERNGLILMKRTGADPVIVRLFALFHDCQRWHDGTDPEHGERGAEYARSLRGVLFELDDEAFERFREACLWHTEGLHHPDPTIGTCWDADRLDLGRVGITPEPTYMSTEFGRRIAETGSIKPFLIPRSGRDSR